MDEIVQQVSGLFNLNNLGEVLRALKHKDTKKAANLISGIDFTGREDLHIGIAKLLARVEGEVNREAKEAAQQLAELNRLTAGKPEWQQRYMRTKDSVRK
jgi:hypothetical protein